ncbi:MAG: carboxypeptidase-like regulatory domain-containing protein [Bacteroidales bacterium]
MKRTVIFVHILLLCCLFTGISRSLYAQAGLDRIIYLAKERGTVYSMLERVSEKSGYLFIYDSKVVDNAHSVKLKEGSRSIREAVYEIIGNQRALLRLVGGHILICEQTEQAMIAEVPTSTGYFTLQGRLLDKYSGVPIAYGTVGVAGNTIGTITNQNGDFRLRLHDSLSRSIIRIFHLGYVAQDIDVSLLVGGPTVLSLEPRVIEIPGVIVRVSNPIKVLRQMLDNRDVNYAQEPVYLTTFYREGVQYKQQFQNLSEAVFKVYKAPLSNNMVGDQVKLLKKSLIANKGMRDTLMAKISAGIDACLQLDFMKQLPDFLIPDESSDYPYVYTSGKSTTIGDRLVNVVCFEQKNGIEYPLYKGELYIDDQNGALLQANIEIHPQFINKAVDMLVVRQARILKTIPQKVTYTVTYKPWNGKYYINHIRGDLFFKVKKRHQWLGSSSLHAWFEMVTCRIETQNVIRFQRNERLPTRTVFSETHFKDDPNFWGEFNVIPWEQELSKIIHEISARVEKLF